MSVADGLWQIAQTCGSSVRLLPCRLSDLWQALQRAMSTTTRRFVALVPVAAATLNTFFTGIRSVYVPLPSMSPAGWPSNPSITVPVTVAGIATADVIVYEPSAFATTPAASVEQPVAALSGFSEIGWPGPEPLPALLKSAVAQPMSNASRAVPFTHCGPEKYGLVTRLYGALPLVGSVILNVNFGNAPGLKLAASSETSSNLNRFAYSRTTGVEGSSGAALLAAWAPAGDSCGRFDCTWQAAHMSSVAGPAECVGFGPLNVVASWQEPQLAAVTIVFQAEPASVSLWQVVQLRMSCGYVTSSNG